MPSALTIPSCVLPPECETLREEVRDFLRTELADRPPRLRADSWTGFDPAFSRAVGARGWIGMTWPRQYGGHERSFFERYVVYEEMLAAGAPVAAHWVADRQIGPLLLRYGTQSMRDTIVPRIARGEAYFGIGMSEPDAGSDLASLRSRAEPVDGGWLLNGRKVWTSFAHKVNYLMVLFRTDRNEQRHAGLSQFLVDMTTPGLAVSPIRNLTGEHHFNEVVFDNVWLPAAALVGDEGQGWNQASVEMAFERSGPDRYLSSIELLLQMLDAASEHADRHAVGIGMLVAQARTLRHVSLGIAGMLARGQDPGVAAAIMKELGTTFEQSIPGIAAELLDTELNDDGDLGAVAARVTMLAPCFSLRGGTREMMRGLIARGLGLR